jgi:predicted nucleic acid-binding protein
VAIFLDTNVLLYSISTDEEEAKKRAAALELLDRNDCALSVQVLLEFYAQATHPSRYGAVTHDNAMLLIGGWMRFPVQENNSLILRSAFELRKVTGFSIWDCNIISAAAASGCKALYTEDLSHDRIVGGVRIINPFLGL